MIAGLFFPEDRYRGPDTASPEQWVAMDSVIVPHRFFTVGLDDNIYLVDSSGALIKYDSAWRQVYRFSSSRLGTPAAVDATDPLRIQVFYADYNILLILDKMLTPVRTIDLSELGLTDVSAVCQAATGGFWAYDRAGSRLVAYEPGRLLPSEEISLSAFSLATVDFVWLHQQDNSLYGLTASGDILRYDVLSDTFQKILGGRQWRGFRWHDGRLYAMNQAREVVIYHSPFDVPKTNTPPIPQKLSGWDITHTGFLLGDGRHIIHWRQQSPGH